MQPASHDWAREDLIPQHELQALMRRRYGSEGNAAGNKSERTHAELKLNTGITLTVVALT